MTGQEQCPPPAFADCSQLCPMTEESMLDLPAASSAAGMSGGAEFFNRLFEMKTPMSQVGQQSNVVRDPVITPAVHPAPPAIRTA